MKWVLKQADSGDMIRVRLGGIYHYGIFVSEEEIIQFGLAPSMRSMLSDSEIEVCASDVDDFLAGGFLEVAVFDRSEKKKNRSPKETVDFARSKLGERGYNILYNNCEHFAYECLTKTKYCSQTDSVRSFFKSLPLLNLYFSAVPNDINISKVEPQEKNAELNAILDIEKRRERYIEWKALEYALEQSFCYNIKKLKFENGAWRTDKCKFDVCLCEGAVAVAISRSDVSLTLSPAANKAQTQGNATTRSDSVFIGGKEFIFTVKNEALSAMKIYSDVNISY